MTLRKTFSDVFRSCTQTKTCGVGKIRHTIFQGTKDEGGEPKQVIGYQCCRCSTITLENAPEKKGVIQYKDAYSE